MQHPAPAAPHLLQKSAPLIPYLSGAWPSQIYYAWVISPVLLLRLTCYVASSFLSRAHIVMHTI